ncbi:MAG: hypothetical protein V1896_02910 [Candidatus Zambryskibacteria bacterium]
MTKKILLIIGILVIVGVALFLIFGSQPQTPGESRVGFSIRDYLPFGSDNTGTETPTDETGTGEETPTIIPTDQPIPRLRRLSSEPVAGAVIFNVGTTSVVRFVEKGTGNVYEAVSDSLAIQRLTNTTIPKIIRAFWLPNGSGFLAQTLESGSEIIETSFVKLNKNKASTTSESLTPFNTTIGKLPTGIKEISIKPDGSKIFYYTANGSSKWFTANPDGTGSVAVMTHPLTEWLPKWISGNTVIMQTKGSSVDTGYNYSFDVSSKVLKKTGVGMSGISTNPNPDGSLSIVSSGGAYPQLYLVDNKKVTLKELNVNSLAEKCVWLKEKILSVYCAVPNQIPNGNYPDIWYKGLVSTEDFIEKIDLNNNIFSNIADLSSLSDQKIDVVDMSAPPDETHLIFRNKIDGYLWMLRIAE